jgi:hypothetical protein
VDQAYIFITILCLVVAFVAGWAAGANNWEKAAKQSRECKEMERELRETHDKEPHPSP